MSATPSPATGSTHTSSDPRNGRPNAAGTSFAARRPTREPSPSRGPAMSLAIDVQRLRFRYGRGPWVLDIPELTLERGTRAFLFGPSGSGKTTLLGVLA
ncbi:MAG: ATP-binding cassette domain-containing protein, partial [Gemmatimonadetes bacterium]|nr:ATP-binding cassette domain-containing protein [Gemmatimonadota bacterium]